MTEPQWKKYQDEILPKIGKLEGSVTATKIRKGPLFSSIEYQVSVRNPTDLSIGYILATITAHTGKPKEVIASEQMYFTNLAERELKVSGSFFPKPNEGVQKIFSNLNLEDIQMEIQFEANTARPPNQSRYYSPSRERRERLAVVASELDKIASKY